MRPLKSSWQRDGPALGRCGDASRSKSREEVCEMDDDPLVLAVNTFPLSPHPFVERPYSVRPPWSRLNAIHEDGSLYDCLFQP